MQNSLLLPVLQTHSSNCLFVSNGYFVLLVLSLSLSLFFFFFFFLLMMIDSFFLVLVLYSSSSPCLSVLSLSVYFRTPPPPLSPHLDGLVVAAVRVVFEALVIVGGHEVPGLVDFAVEGAQGIA